MWVYVGMYIFQNKGGASWKRKRRVNFSIIKIFFNS